MGVADSKAPSAEALSFRAEKRQRCSWCGQLSEDCTCGQPKSSCRACKAYQTCQGYRMCPACEEDASRLLTAYDVRDLDTVVERVEENQAKDAQRNLVQCRDGGTVKTIFADAAQECCICMVNRANVVLMPCGHSHLCTHCLEGLVSEGMTKLNCPTCRQLVSSAHELAPFTEHALDRPILNMILQREERKSCMKGGSIGSASYRWTKRRSALKSALKDRSVPRSL
jgi:hypothetical protein